MLPDIAVNVGGVGKGVDAGVGDEGLDLLDGVAAGDTGGQAALELMLHGCDRTRSTATRCSPRRPEPQDDVVAFEIVRVDETAADGVLDEAGGLGVDQVRRTAFDGEESSAAQATASGATTAVKLVSRTQVRFVSTSEIVGVTEAILGSIPGSTRWRRDS